MALSKAAIPTEASPARNGGVSSVGSSGWPATLTAPPDEQSDHCSPSPVRRVMLSLECVCWSPLWARATQRTGWLSPTTPQEVNTKSQEERQEVPTHLVPALQLSHPI